MKKNKKVKVKRHSKLFIFLHWLIVIEILTLLLTGLSVSEGINIGLLSRGTARSIHIVVGFAWLATITFFVYYFVMSGEYKWFSISRIGYGLDFMVEEIRCLLRRRHIPNPVGYSLKKKDYIEKIVPSEVLAWWGWFVLWVIIGTSGLALLFPQKLGLINRFWHFVMPDYSRATASTRGIHLLAAIFIVAMAVFHAYFTIIFGMWKSIFVGTNEEPVVEE